jgi:hypothetical protein
MTCVVLVGGGALAVMYLIKAIRGSWALRVSQEGELEGLDIHEHGTPPYHVEFGHGMTYSTPAGLRPPLPVGVGGGVPPTAAPPPPPVAPSESPSADVPA